MVDETAIREGKMCLSRHDGVTALTAEAAEPVVMPCAGSVGPTDKAPFDRHYCAQYRLDTT